MMRQNGKIRTERFPNYLKFFFSFLAFLWNFTTSQRSNRISLHSTTVISCLFYWWFLFSFCCGKEIFCFCHAVRCNNRRRRIQHFRLPFLPAGSLQCCEVQLARNLFISTTTFLNVVFSLSTNLPLWISVWCQTTITTATTITITGTTTTTITTSK